MVVNLAQSSGVKLTPNSSPTILTKATKSTEDTPESLRLLFKSKGRPIGRPSISRLSSTSFLTRSSVVANGESPLFYGENPSHKSVPMLARPLEAVNRAGRTLAARRGFHGRRSRFGQRPYVPPRRRGCTQKRRRWNG